MIKKFREFNEGFFSRYSIKVLLRKFNIYDYSINSDLSIDVNGDVNFSGRIGGLYSIVPGIKEIPFNFNSVSGDFRCDRNDLIDLSGCPKYVGGHFDCSSNKLSSLEDCPKYVGGVFLFERNKIFNVDVAPKEVGKGFFHRGNPISDILCQIQWIDYQRYSHDEDGMDSKVLEVWNSFNPVYEKDGKWYVIEHRFKELYYYLTGKDFEGKFPNYHSSYLENGPEKGGFPYIIVKV